MVLIHYGKKGMRWGKRTGPSRSEQIKTARKNLDEYHEISNQKRKHYGDALTDSGYRKSGISKEELDKRYADMTSANNRYLDSYSLAQKRTGGEYMAGVLGTLGAVSVMSLIAGVGIHRSI